MVVQYATKLYLLVVNSDCGSFLTIFTESNFLKTGVMRWGYSFSF